MPGKHSERASRSMRTGLSGGLGFDLEPDRGLSPVGEGYSRKVQELELTDMRSGSSRHAENEQYEVSGVLKENESEIVISTSPSQRKTNQKCIPVDGTHNNGDNEKALTPNTRSASKPGNGDRNCSEVSAEYRTYSGISSASSEVDIPLPAFSRMSDTSIVTHTSEPTPEVDENGFDFFCFDHGILVTRKEAVEHTECENLIPAQEWAEAQTVERDRSVVETRLMQFDMFAARMVEDRQELQKQLDNQKDEVTENFLDVMEDLIAHLLKKQQQFMSHVAEVHLKQSRGIDEQIKRCQRVQKDTRAFMDQLANCEVGSEKFKSLKRTIQEKCPVYEEILRLDFNNSTRLTYEYRQNPLVEQVFGKLSSLGDVIVRPHPSTLPGFLSASEVIEFAKKSINMVSVNEGASVNDENKCCFTGGTFISGGRLILADWNNGCLKLFNKNAIPTHRLALPNAPWDVKLLSYDQVIVTVPGDKLVLIVQCSLDKGMEIVTTFQTDAECWGAAPLNGDLVAMTTDPWSRSPIIKVYTLKGKLTSFYEKNGSGEALFTYPEHITTDASKEVLYISDSKKNSVIALTLGGCLLFRYSHKDLRCPSGLAVDTQGNLYICGKESNNIHQVTSSGQLVRILLQNEVQSPRAICMGEGERILLTSVNCDTCNEFLVVQME
ncbi:uncharacterized protein LOC127842819 [Dreissena polymorpha]|uniref:Uncharacterized protein n=1 Tax=Dreissena polymorpha TaxID=45954 RepID=A0A9D4IX95_DREPO|nr:uncharacterized protein LOC127842819 [Dreissena polymorpha]KAH3788164.1 hypothetical protein DPMN_166296 [Dreissena polymorpha]